MERDRACAERKRELNLCEVQSHCTEAEIATIPCPARPPMPSIFQRCWCRFVSVWYCFSFFLFECLAMGRLHFCFPAAQIFAGVCVWILGFFHSQRIAHWGSLTLRAVQCTLPSDRLALLSPISFPTVRLVCNFFLHILLWSPWLSDSHSYLCLVACIDSTHRYARTHPTAAGWVGEWFYDCLQFCNCNWGLLALQSCQTIELHFRIV